MIGTLDMCIEWQKKDGWIHTMKDWIQKLYIKIWNFVYTEIRGWIMDE